jgi:hypothetical protein
VTDHQCVLCALRKPPRARLVADARVCSACRHGLRTDLTRILDLVTLAATMPDPFASRPSSSGPRSHPASRPPIDVAHINPELIGIRVDDDARDEDGDPVTVALLDLLETWERAVRAQQGFASYGLASTLRDPLLGERAAAEADLRRLTTSTPWAWNPEGISAARTRLAGLTAKIDAATPTSTATLTAVIGFLTSQADWMCDAPGFPIERFSVQLRRVIAQLRSLDLTRTRRDGWGIPCPADLDDGQPCTRRLTIDRHDDGRLDLHTDLTCPDCGTTWTAQRLLLVALADDRVTVWGYPDAIAGALGITDRTLRRWAEAGHVPRIGGRYDAGAAFRHRHALNTSTGA